jgi:hypothetical protein
VELPTAYFALGYATMYGGYLPAGVRSLAI